MQRNIEFNNRKTFKKSISLKKVKAEIWKYRAFYIMLAPGLIWYFIFRYMPMYGITIAFKDFSIMDGIMRSPWADPWYKHFQTFFNSPYFIQLLRNTIIISFLKIFLGMLPPILLALILNECRVSWFKRLIQTLSYMPHFLSWVIIYGILIAFFSESNGLFNKWIVEAGGRAIPFLTSTRWFRPLVIGSDIWQGAGWGAIVYLAAIAGIDQSLYEAARIDGCSRLKMIIHITLPGIRSVIVMLFILRLGSVLDAGFEQIYNLYNIQVYEVADVLDTWVFRTGIEQLNFSIAAAVGLFKSAIGFIFVISSNKLAKKWGEGIW